MKIEVLRMSYCEEANLNPSSVKFLIDGQRLHDDETPNSLGLIDGDIIEVYMEMIGGGWPQKNLHGDVCKIQEIQEATQKLINSE